MVIPIEMLEKTNIKQHQAMEDKINEIVDVVNDQGLETIKDTVNDVKARVGVLETENDTQDTEISQLGNRVSAVEQKNTTQDAQISEVTGRVATAEGKINALENDKADSSDVTALANRVTAVEQKNTAQDTEISTVTDKVGTIESRTDAIEDDVTSIQGSITNLENDKADTTDVTALGNRVTAVENKNTTQDTEISELGTRVTAVEGEIPDISYSGPFLSDFIIRMIGDNEPEMRFTSKTLNGATSALTQDIPKAQSNVYGVVRLGDLVVKNQGTANAGKALVVGSDGMVAPGDVGGGGSGAVWGQITGDIANQTDLQSEIGSKANASDVTALANRVTAVEEEIADISDNGPFITKLYFNESSAGLNLGYSATTLQGVVSGSAMQVPTATDDKHGVVTLSDLVVKDQGTANAGKALVVGSDGMVAPGDVGGGGGGITTYSFSDINMDFNDLKEWVKTSGSYKQISGSFNGGNGFQVLDLTVGGSGSTLYGGGTVGIRTPDTSFTYYPISSCFFNVENNDVISFMVDYILQDGTSSNVNVSINRNSSQIRGVGFIIN